jgi:hypothetical protein
MAADMDDLPELLWLAARGPTRRFDVDAAWRRGTRRRRVRTGVRAGGVAALAALAVWLPTTGPIHQQRMAATQPGVVAMTALATVTPAAPAVPAAVPLTPAPAEISSAALVSPVPSAPADPPWLEMAEHAPVPAAPAGVVVSDGAVTVTAGALGLDAQAFTAALVQAGAPVETRSHPAPPADAGKVLGIETADHIVDPAHESFRIVVAELTAPLVVHAGAHPDGGDGGRSAFWPGEVLGSAHCAGEAPLSSATLERYAQQAGVRVDWRLVLDDGSRPAVGERPDGRVVWAGVEVSDWVVAVVVPWNVPDRGWASHRIPCDAGEAARWR